MAREPGRSSAVGASSIEQAGGGGAARMDGARDHEGEGARTGTGAGSRPDHHPHCRAATAPAQRPRAWRGRVRAM